MTCRTFSWVATGVPTVAAAEPRVPSVISTPVVRVIDLLMQLASCSPDRSSVEVRFNRAAPSSFVQPHKDGPPGPSVGDNPAPAQRFREGDRAPQDAPDHDDAGPYGSGPGLDRR